MPSEKQIRKLPDETYRKVREIVSKEILDNVSDLPGIQSPKALIKNAHKRCKAVKLDVTEAEVERIYDSV